MADVTIYKPASVTVSVIDGDPPVDQSALVAQLTAQLADMTSQRDALAAKITAAKAALA